MGACALLLLIVPATAQSQSEAILSAQLTRHLATMKKDQQVLTFLKTHKSLLSDPLFRTSAQQQLRVHTSSLARVRKRAAAAKVALAQKAKERRLAAVAVAKPQNAICRVFGRYCREAVAVSRCESELSTTAQNGQYLGLFQMGTTARQLYGHGPTALEQAQAAHRYFVDSGHGWSPWSCKPY